MRGFTATELANNTGDVLMAAAGTPVEITRHGKPQFVLMTQDLYQQLLAETDIDLAPVTHQEPSKTVVKARVKKTAKKTKRKKKKAKDDPAANAKAAVELMQALQSWSDD